jgi:hypothetical protein
MMGIIWYNGAKPGTILVTLEIFTIKKRDQYVFDLYELIDIYELLKNIDLNGSICENIDLNDFTLI